MIKQLDHQELTIAEDIRKVFQVSYAVEAELLGATDFPPLQRPLEGFTEADSQFFGYLDDEVLAAVIEVKEENDVLHIHSLVVHPAFFRRGIASKLINYLFEHFNVTMFTVETGADNGPAIALYERHGFVLIRKWMTDFGIEKVAFERTVG